MEFPKLKKLKEIGLFLGLFLIILLLVVWKGFLVLFLLLFLAILWFFSYRLDLGIYILAFLTPIMHWNFQLVWFRDFLKDFPDLLTFYASVVDVWAVFLLLALAINLLRRKMTGVKIILQMPGLLFYILFLLSAVLSIVNVFNWEIIASLKYIIRFPLFVYLGYVVLGVNIIQNRRILENTMLAFVVSAFLGALMGGAFLHLLPEAAEKLHIENFRL
jgi:hypothetical protein